MNIVRLAFIALIALTAAAQAGLPTLHGHLQLPIASIDETLKPFDIMVKGKMRNTGKVTLTLDPDGTRNPTLTFDFDAKQMEIDTDLLINAPLLRRLNSPTTTVAVTETGHFKILKARQKGDEVTLTVVYKTNSTGVVKGGPADGAQYRNKKDPTRCPRYPPQGWFRMSVTVDGDGNVLDGKAVAPLNQLCSDDNGTLTFEDQQLSFTGTRKGLVGE